MRTNFIIVIFIVFALCMRVVSSHATLNFARKRMFSQGTDSAGTDSFSILIGNSKKIPFSPPSMHPFETIQQLKRVREQDPYSFPIEHYSHSEVVTRKFFQQYESSGNMMRSIRKIMVEGTDYIPLKEHANYIQEGSLHSYSLDANILTGVAFLDQDESVWDVKCGTDGTTIQIDFSNGHSTARKWIPGTRLVIGKKWNCFGSSTFDMYGKEDQLAFQVMSRSIVGEADQMVKINFNVRMLKNNELFLNGQLSYKSTPIARQAESNFTSLHSGDQNKATRLSWTKPLYAVGFNYDVKSASVKQSSIPLYSNGDFKVVCENCYIYLNADFRIEFEWTWTSIVKAQALVGGKVEADATLKASITKTYSYSKGDILATLSSINFSFNLYGIPVWITIVPKLAYSFDFQASGILEYSRNFKASYEQSIGYQYSSSKGYEAVRFGNGFEWSSYSPGLRLQANASSEFSLYPTFDITVWSLITTTVSVKPILMTELAVEGLATSLSDYQLFAKLQSFYRVDLTINNEIFKVDHTIEIITKTSIPSLSASYSLQSSSFKAVETSDKYSTGNTLPTLTSVTDVVYFYFLISIAPSDKDYFVEYSSGLTPPSGFKYSTDSYNCKKGCDFTFNPTSYININVVEDGLFMFNTAIFTNLFDLRSYFSNPPLQSTRLYSKGLVTSSLQVTQRIVKFKEMPSNTFTVNANTIFEFDKKSFLEYNFIAFKSDRAISNLPFQFMSLNVDGAFYYYSNYAPNSFTISGSTGAVVKFVNAIAYRMVYPKTTVSLYEVIRDSSSLNTFVQAVETVSNRYVVTLQARGSFDILVYEAWLADYNIYQTKGKKYQYIEPQTGSVESLPLRTHHFTFSLENSYGTAQQKIQLVVAQLVPINSVIIQSLRFDPYSASELTGSTTSTKVVIEQQVAKNSIFPYLSVSSTKSTKVSFSNSLYETLKLSSGIVDVSSTQVSIPIPSSFDTFYLSPNTTTSDTINVNLVQNYKLLNGIPSLVKKMVSSEVGSFAIPCSSSVNWNAIYLRLIDVTTGTVVQTDSVKASIMTNNAQVLVQLDPVTVSNGAIILSSIETINTLCKTDSANRYVQITVQNSASTITRHLEISQTLDYSKVNTRAITQFTIDPEVSGYFYLDMSNEKNKYELAKSNGLIFTVNTLDNCNIDLYINKKGQVASPSFTDSNSIYSSSTSLSVTQEKMSISLLSDHGSILMFYSDKKCRFTLSTEELKTSQLALSFIVNGKPSSFINSLSYNETLVIHVDIVGTSHAWDKNFVNNVTAASVDLYKLFGMSAKISKVFSSVNFVLINEQSLAFEFIPKASNTQALDLYETISFKSDSNMFDTRYDIQPRNQLIIGQPMASNSTSGQKTNSAELISLSYYFYCLLILVCCLVQ